jgi:GMP synthase-like glutamine amidotransferase
MKILLIDNHTEHKQALAKALAGHEVEVQKYRPGLDFHTEGKDLVILSGGGGQGREIYDVHQSGHLWYQDEINFVRNCQKPLLGICMGLEIICRAYGSKVEEMAKVLEGPTDLTITRKGKKLLLRKTIRQHEAHKWRIKKAPEGFKTLAKSPTGIEILQHKKKPILATQFHPELGGSLQLQDLIRLALP